MAAGEDIPRAKQWRNVGAWALASPRAPAFSPGKRGDGSPRAVVSPGDRPCVLQVGSFGTGTALRGRAEVQLVAFLSCFRSFQEAARQQHAALRLLRRTLWTCRDLLDLGLEVLGVSQGVPDALAFTIQTRCTQEPVTVTIVPAYRALGKREEASRSRGPFPRPAAAPSRSPLPPASAGGWGPPCTGCHGAPPGKPISQRITRVNI